MNASRGAISYAETQTISYVIGNEILHAHLIGQNVKVAYLDDLDAEYEPIAWLGRSLAYIRSIRESALTPER